MSTPEILVLGGSGAGKTHYAGQLLGRATPRSKGKAATKPGGVKDLNKLEEVLSCLEEGRAAGRHASQDMDRFRCELVTNDGANALLEWPEYAGERVFSIVEQRVLPLEWRTSVNNASGWILFVRPSTLQIFEDLLERPTGVPPRHTRSEASSIDGKGWDDRARYVELLQMLMFASGKSTFKPVSSPRLAVVISCWDEIEAPGTPEETFAGRLPLVDAFVRSTWHETAWSVWGLSSLGRALSQDRQDPEFAQRGPEHFGYVSRPAVPPRSLI